MFKPSIYLVLYRNTRSETLLLTFQMPYFALKNLDPASVGAWFTKTYTFIYTGVSSGVAISLSFAYFVGRQYNELMNKLGMRKPTNFHSL